MAQTPYTVVAGGVDKLIVNVQGCLRSEIVERLEDWQALAIAERDAKHGHNREQVAVDTGWQIGGQPLLMLPHGGGKGQWTWLLRCPAVTLELGTSSLNEITCRATLSAPFLWQFGPRRAWSFVERVVGRWVVRAEDDTQQPNAQRWLRQRRHAFHDDSGLLPARFQVSELHLCADVAGLNAAELDVSAFVHRGTVARWYLEDAEVFRAVATPHQDAVDKPQIGLYTRYRELETLAFSLSAPHSATLYNKPREIRTKSPDKIWFADIWRRHGWDGSAPITRVEMRYERTALRELGCNTVMETFERCDALWGYSTQQWLRHTAPNRNERDRSRWPTSPWWQAVQGASFGKPHTAPAQRRKAHAFQEERMLAAIFGYLESWVAYGAGKQPVEPSLDFSTVAHALADRADEHYERKATDFYAEVLKRRKRIGYPA
jgi:hypothetical protein